MANASDPLSNAEESIIEGKDATLDADDNGWIENFSGVDGLGRECQPSVQTMTSNWGPRTLRKLTIFPGWSWTTACTCFPAPR